MVVHQHNIPVRGIDVIRISGEARWRFAKTFTRAT